MARFRFKLQKVLDVRRSFEDNAKREFGEAKRVLAQLTGALEDLIDQRECLLIEMTEHRKQGAIVMQFQDDIQREWQFRMDIRQQKHRIRKAQEELENKRKKLVQAMKDRKIMEKLRERNLQEFMESVRKEELRFSDEIAGRSSHFADKPKIGE
ncbi:MAG: flagellar export protein FliJ [candidate division Zixibacteria bacterium]|nr:flagellar export protein FliJ [Candidatus Tariuqbacter arcticus]